MMIDVARARRETPGCESVVHLNNAGASLMPVPVVDTVVGHLRREAEIGGYEAAAERAADLDDGYSVAAGLLNARPEEVAFIENATRAWDMAFYAIPWSEGDRIVTSETAYASDYLAFLQVQRKYGVAVDVVPSQPGGALDLGALEDMLARPATLLALTHIPTNSGLVNPIEEAGAIARDRDVLYLVDACQSVGQMPVDVEAIGCDLLSTTSRKYLRGPRGAGLLYVRAEVLDRLEPPMIDLRAARWVADDDYELRSDARRFENWESNVAARLGLVTAIDYALGWGLDRIEYWVQTLAAVTRQRLAEVPGVTVADPPAATCGIITFTVDGMAPQSVKAELGDAGINVDASSVYSTRLDMRRRGLDEVVRASVHYFNTEAEIETLCAVLAGLASGRAR